MLENDSTKQFRQFVKNNRKICDKHPLPSQLRHTLPLITFNPYNMLQRTRKYLRHIVIYIEIIIF